MVTNLGVSELPGRTFGKMQVMSNDQAARNLVAAVAELRLDYGEVVTFNEGDRSRPDQLYMRDQYLNHGGALAAFCTQGPPPQFTSTHDPENHGDAADLGGPGGTVISENARELLDGNHPRGVIGRKYGVYGTGMFFARVEIWHFNVYPSRAEVLVPVGFPLPDIIPLGDDDMKLISHKERGLGLAGPGYFYPVQAGQGDAAAKLASETIACDSAAEWDAIRDMSLRGTVAVDARPEAVWAHVFKTDGRSAGQWLTSLPSRVATAVWGFAFKSDDRTAAQHLVALKGTTKE